MVVESAKLKIECSPEVNAKVILNHEDTGKTTPAEFTLVKGEYIIELVPPQGYAVAEWWVDGVPVSNRPLLNLVLDADKTVVAHIIISQQQMVTQTSVSIVNLVLVIVSLLLIISLIKEMIGTFGSLRG